MQPSAARFSSCSYCGVLPTQPEETKQPQPEQKTRPYLPAVCLVGSKNTATMATNSVLIDASPARYRVGSDRLRQATCLGPLTPQFYRCPLRQKRRQPGMQPIKVSKLLICTCELFQHQTPSQTTGTRPVPGGRIRGTARARTVPQGTCIFPAFGAKTNCRRERLTAQR